MKVNATAAKIFGHSVLISVVLFTLAPLAYTLLTSLKLFRDIISGSFFQFVPTMRNYEELFFGSRNSFVELTRNSILIGIGTMIVVVFVAALGAYSLSRFRWPSLVNNVIMGWLLFINMLPPIVFVGPLYLTARSLGIYDTLIAVILGHTILNLPLGFWMLRSYFAEVPHEIEEAARVDGGNRWQIFRLVVIPLTRPGLAATAILVFVFSWKDFLFALSLTSTSAASTIPVGIASFAQEYNIRYGEMAAAAFFATIPALLLVVLAQRWIIQGLTTGAIKG